MKMNDDIFIRSMPPNVQLRHAGRMTSSAIAELDRPSRVACSERLCENSQTRKNFAHIFDMTHFDESSRWMGWSKIEFSHSLAIG